MQKHLQILYKSIRLKVQIKGVQNMEKLLDLAVQYDGVKTKILPNGVQFKKDKKSVTYYPSTGTVVSDEKGEIKVYKRAGMELLEKELHAAFYQPVDLYKTSEYLVDIRGKWELQLLTDDTPESETCVRVPEGAIKATLCNGFLIFWRDEFFSLSKKDNDTEFTYMAEDDYSFSEYMSVYSNDDVTLLWQRKETVVELMRKLSGKMSSDIFGRVAAFTHELPFTTPELSEEYQALCDRVEVIDKEAARYMREEAPMLDSFDGCSILNDSFVWKETPHGYNYWSKLEKALLEPSSCNHIGEAEEAPSAAIGEHSHYFKDVSKLEVIDVYAVLELFGVTNPCMQHIVKKALCTGKRGHKDFAKDLQDIADTANRAVELNKQFYG